MQDGIRNQTGRELDGGKEEVGLREIRRTWERGSHAHGRRCRVKGWVIRAAWNGLVSRRDLPSTRIHQQAEM